MKSLIQSIAQLPGIGPRSARKIAYFLVLNPKISEQLRRDIKDIQSNIVLCSKCNNIDSSSPCSICSSTRENILCIVRNHLDMSAIESTKAYHGMYFIIGDHTSPSSNNSSDVVEHLCNRIREGCGEIVMALTPSIENRIMSEYLSIKIRDAFSGRDDMPVITTIALGIPMGGSFEYLDHDTIISSISSRSKM